MRIRHKIFLGYLAIVAVSVVLVSVFLSTLYKINNEYSDLLDHDQWVLLQAIRCRSGIDRQIVAARTYEQLGDPSLYAEYNEAINLQKRSLDQIAPYLEDEDDVRRIEEIKQAADRYTRVAQQAINLSLAGDQHSVISIRRNQGEPARITLLNRIEGFIDKKSKEVAASEAQLQKEVGEASSRLLLGAVIGVLSALIAATLMTEGLTSPLRRLMRHIHRISAGDLKTAVPSESSDEIGELAAVVEAMRQKLSTAAAENEQLLAITRQEADKLAQTRQELEEANAELNEALAIESQARKHIEEVNRIKSEFASMISHELKTPVSYVYNYAGALKEHHESLNEGQRREFLTAIQSEALHLLTLIDDIMAISLLESGGLNHRFVETDLRTLTDSVVKDQQLTTRRHTLTVKGPSSLPVRADPTRLKQVLNNLLSNAIKYSPQGGPIEVRLRANPANGAALIYVRDYGIGIRQDDVPKLFDRFSRIQRRETMAIPGSGLGLYIAHHIVEAHGGTLSLEPAPGKGTIAEVTVPLMPGASVDSTETNTDALKQVVPTANAGAGSVIEPETVVVHNA